MQHRVITFVLFAASTILWLWGMGSSGALILGAAVVLEFIAWKRVLTRQNNLGRLTAP